METNTSSNPESCVLVVVDRIIVFDCAHAGATVPDATSAADSSVHTINRRAIPSLLEDSEPMPVYVLPSIFTMLERA